MILNGALVLSTLACIAQATTGRSLPTVDLEYEVHRAISYNVSGHLTLKYTQTKRKF